MPDLLFQPTPHKEAVAYIAGKSVVSREVFNGLLPELRARAFVIAGIEDANTVQQIRDLVAALPAGANWKDQKKQIAALASPFFVDPDADEETRVKQQAAAERKAELLLRTHGGQAYSAAAWQVQQRQKKVFPFWKYQSMGDGHVRESHAALDGVVLPADHEFWTEHYPPWQWGCRCLVVALSRDDYEDQKKADAPKPEMERDILQGTRLRRLEEERKINRGPSMDIDLRSDREKGKPSGYQWDPGDVKLTAAQLKDRYDPEVWSEFEAWAKKTKLTQRKTVWQWLGGDEEKSAVTGWPADLSKLKAVRRLGGSTGAELVSDPATGRNYVLKRGNSPAHLREEFAADQAYQATGVNVPPAKLYETEGGPVKLAEFVEGQTLKAFLAKASVQETKIIFGKLQEHFVTDALFANYDVVGLDLDNILIDKAGQIWRIDNGGSFRFRAQGGAKTGWGPEVRELETMLDPKVNASAAKVFGSISAEEIRRQIETLETQREALLASVPPEIREVLAKRLDFLKSTIAGPDFAKQVADSRIVGKVSKRDKGDIEDTQVLFWQEMSPSGDLVTRAKLKLTEAGSAKIVARLQDSLPKPLTGTAAADASWPVILKAAKTINAHVSDGKYNALTMAELSVLKGQLAAAKKPTAGQRYYLSVIDQLEKAHSSKTAAPLLKPFEAKAQAPAAGDHREFTVERRSVEYFAKTTQRGRAKEEAKAIYSHEALLLTVDDVRIKFVPYKEASGLDFNAPYAFRGYVEILNPSAASNDSIQRILHNLEKIGLDTTPATENYAELMYLRKGMQIRSDVFTPAKLAKADALLANESATEIEKIAGLRGTIETELKIKLPSQTGPNYDPQGKANSYGQGWIRTDRWDLPRAQIEKELAAYKLHHSSRRTVSDLVDSILEGGGDFTSTTERLRKGIPISEGMSPTTDLGTGGANYLFTRIKTTAQAEKVAGLNFKVGLLARQDAFTFDHDRFGNVKDATAYTTRKRTVAEFKAASKKGGNETIFKWGIPFLDEIDTIVCPSAAERKAVIATFTKHGYTTLPDGRSIEEVVILL